MDPNDPPPRPPELLREKTITPDIHKALRRMVIRQIEEKDPPEVEKTLKNLLGKGHPENQAMILLCSTLAMELYEVFNEDVPFDKEHYKKQLKEFWQ